MGDDAEFVLEPVRRAAALEHLLSETASRSELQDHLDVSRATLHRIVTFLRDNDLLVETDDGLELTTLGELVGEEVTGYVDRMETARQLAPLLNGMDTGALAEPLSLDLFEDVSVTRPGPGRPQRPAQRVVELVEHSDSIRGFSPVVMPIYVEVFDREIRAGTETQMIVEPSVLAGLEEEYTGQLEGSMATGNLELLVHERLPFGMFLTPETVALLGYDDDGVLRVLVEGGGDRLRAWAEAVYESVRADADPV
jgi:predicted transcriptional regulator